MDIENDMNCALNYRNYSRTLPTSLKLVRNRRYMLGRETEEGRTKAASARLHARRTGRVLPTNAIEIVAVRALLHAINSAFGTLGNLFNIPVANDDYRLTDSN